MNDMELIAWICSIFLLGVAFAVIIEETFYVAPAKADALAYKQELVKQTKVFNDMKTILGGMLQDCTMQNPCICGAEAVNGSFRVGCQKTNFEPQNLSDSQYRINETH